MGLLTRNNRRRRAAVVQQLAKLTIQPNSEVRQESLRLALSGAPRNQPLVVTIDVKGEWSDEPFNIHLGPDFEFSYGYHPYGRHGALATFVANELNITAEFLLEQIDEPGRVY
jgi:hypothetical protein